MRSLEDIPAIPLRSALSASGWRVAAVEGGGEWWCRERWHLRSNRVPPGREAWLSFLVDPEHVVSPPKIWAVKASASQASGWQSGPAEHTLSFSSGWRRQIPGLIDYLDGLQRR